jgi:uncharacterized protein (DUF2237 family)
MCPGSSRESTKSYRRRTLRLALLAPDIVGAILTAGRNRWKEALDAGMAPRVVLRATHEEALDYLALADLKMHALDLA